MASYCPRASFSTRVGTLPRRSRVIRSGRNAPTWLSRRTALVPAMKLAFDANFGSVERWREEFSAMGKAQGGGSGWVLLVFVFLVAPVLTVRGASPAWHRGR